MLFRAAVISVILIMPLLGQINVLTVNYDNYRTNANLNETVLNTSIIKPNNFGKIYSYPVDGNVYTQPLYVSALEIPGRGVFSVILVATAHNTVYAFDADARLDSGDAVLWQVNLGPSVPADVYGTRDIAPEVGVLGTPVIDLSTNTIYVVANTLEDGGFYYRLHALDIATGSEKFGSPSVIEASVPGTSEDSQNGFVAFDPFFHLQRPGLLLSYGVVYIAFGSHGDDGAYHGWLLGYDAGNVSNQLYAFNVTPNGAQGAIWQGGRGPAADDFGNVYVISSNGDYDGTSNFSESFLKLDSKLTLLDWFTPEAWPALNEIDYDLGSSGPLLLPGTDFVVGGSKEGRLYVVQQSKMGRNQPGDAGVVQSFQAVGFGIFNFAMLDDFSGPIVYVQARRDSVDAFRLNRETGQFDSAPFTRSRTVNGTPYQGMTISTNGGQPGTAILWVSSADDILHAFNATDLSNELWNSSMSRGDDLGSFAKFASPTVANGKVYVPTFAGQLVVYGLLSPATP